MDKISIVVPVYNVASYLTRCVEALLAQTYANLEILLVDDCSTDGSRDILAIYAQKDRRIRLLYQTTNQGVSAARNRALEEMTGDWVCFCDGDDWYRPDFVEKMYQCAINEKADYIVCNYQITSDAHPPVVSSSVSGLFTGCDNRLVIACGPTASWSHMFSRELVISSGVHYPVGCRQYEELPVIPVLAKYAKRIAVVDEPLYCYYQRGNGTSASNAAFESEKNFLTAWELFKSALGKGYEEELEYHAIYALLYGEILQLCKKGAPSKQIKEKIIEYESRIPRYMENPYLPFLGKAKNLYLRMCQHKCIVGLRMLSWIHRKIVN